MSDVTKLAEREALRAEAEPDENEEGEEGEQDEDTPPETPEDTPPVELPQEPQPDAGAMSRAVESEIRRHEKAFAKAVGVEPDDLEVCGVCQGVGFIGAGTQQERELALLGALRNANEWLAANDPAREYAERDDTQQCEKCHGLGMMRTGSRVPNNEVLPCPTCSGAGYTMHQAQTVPLGNGEVTQQAAPADPTIEALRAQGYTIIAPFTTPVVTP